MVRVGVVAVDGTKVHANACERATRDYEQIARAILERAAEIDALEDEQFGDRRGDERRRRWRRARAVSAGCATRSGVWSSAPPSRRGRSRARAPSGCWKRGVGWRRSLRSSGARTPNMRPTARAG